MRDGTGAGIRGIAVEPSGIGVAGLRRDWVGSVEAGGGGFAIWKCGDVDDVVVVLWIGVGFVAEGDAVWESGDLSGLHLATSCEFDHAGNDFQ